MLWCFILITALHNNGKSQYGSSNKHTQCTPQVPPAEWWLNHPLDGDLLENSECSTGTEGGHNIKGSAYNLTLGPMALW